MVSSYNGWTASRDPDELDIDDDFTAAGRKFPGGVKRGPVSVVLRHVVEQFDKRVEEVDRYDPGDEWGYVYKQSANSANLVSCHSSGTAVDINATAHPNGTPAAKTFTADQIKAIKAILAELDGVVRWLGEARTPDPMHFEIAGDEQDVARVAGRLLAAEVQPLPEEDDMPPAPSAVIDQFGKRWVFIRSTDDHLWSLNEGAERDHGGELTSGPSAVLRVTAARTYIEVVARGTDGASWSVEVDPTNGSNSGWTRLGGSS